MLKRIFGIITALMLCSCMVVTALADGVNLEDFDVPVTEPPSNIVMSVDFESFDPNTTVQHVTGGIIWAVVSIENYAEEIGDVAFNANFESSSYDRVIAGISAEIDLGSDAFSLYADENGDVIWSSPYASMNKLGSVTAGLYDNMIHTLVTVDDNSGFDHPLSAELLDEARENSTDKTKAELFRIAIILNKDVIYDDAQLKLVEKDPYSVFTSTIAIVNKEAGETAADAKFKDIKPRASDDVYAYEAGTPGTQKTMFTSFNANNWSYGEAYRSKLDNKGELTAYSAFYTADQQIAGDPNKHEVASSDPCVDGFAITSQSYDLSNGFELTFNAKAGTVVQNMDNALLKYIYAKVGDYTFSMTGYLLPQIFYRGEYQSNTAENYTVVTGTGVNAGGASPYNISKYKYKSVNDRENLNRILYVTGYWDGWAYKTSKTVNLNTAGTETYTFYYETQSTTAPSSTKLDASVISKLNTVYSNSSLGLVKESTDISKNKYTIKLSGKTLTFKKVVNSTTVFEHRMTVTDEMLNGFKNATIAIGGEHSFLNDGYYKNPKLVVQSATPSTADKAYTSVAVGSNKDGITYTATSSKDTQTVTKINTVLGDIVKDGVIRASDYTALKAALTSNGKYTLDAAQMMQADIDLNGRINTADTNTFWLTLAKTTKKSAYTK